MDRASDFGSEGWGFESLRARKSENFALVEYSCGNSWNSTIHRFIHVGRRDQRIPRFIPFND